MVARGSEAPGYVMMYCTVAFKGYSETVTIPCKTDKDVDVGSVVGEMHDFINDFLQRRVYDAQTGFSFDETSTD